MQRYANVLAETAAPEGRVSSPSSFWWRYLALGITGLVLLFVVFYNLTDYPLTWFDEGSHLHVPKTLLRFGVDADYSSEGFRYEGPTVGVGPTVMLPIWAVFRLFGPGLLQARLVMVLYLLAAIFAFYSLARLFGGARLAWVATALLVASRGTALLEYGRQVLGEVPGFFFLAAGLALWFSAWEKAGWRRLALVGLLLGLATVTKNQYLLLLAPALVLAWLANLVYYRLTPQRVFLVPGLVTAACFALWQAYMILYLGPATAGENLAALRTATAGAAMVFSPELMKRGVQELISFKVYLGWLLPVLAYGLFLALPRRREGQQWGLLLLLVVVNLAWYVLASISWLRYAFPGLALSSLFVAYLFYNLTGGYQLHPAGLWQALRSGQPAWPQEALRWAMAAWLLLMIALPLAQTARQIAAPGFNAPLAMAAYLKDNVSPEALIDTWEPEMGFLTDHNYHFPPPLLLNTAVGYMWLDKEPPAASYNFVQETSPEYVLVGTFARWVDLYPPELLSSRYKLLDSVGPYDLYRLEPGGRQ